MHEKLDIVDSLFNELRELSPLKQEDKNRLDKKLRLEFNYNSNHLEGNTLTYGETELLLIFDDTIGKHQMREYEEIKAHDVAYRLIEELAEDHERPLTESIIKSLNEVILVRPYWKDALTPDGQKTRRQIKIGNYKEYPNSVILKNGEIFEYASPAETPVLMRELIDWFRLEASTLHPITLATMLHYKFVRIHPFDDGNGRISRLLMNYVLLKNSYPPVIIKSADKNNYLQSLHIADLGNYEPLIEYVAENAIWSLNLSIKAAKSESLEETGDFLKEIEIIKRKTSLQKVPKSPAVVYETFIVVRDNIWKSVLETLTHFDSLFNESRNAYLVNHLEEKFETKTISNFDFSFLKHITNEPQNLKIFGHEIYSTDVKNIEFNHNMLGLRGSEKPTNMLVRLEIQFNHDMFTLQFKANHITMLTLNKNYKEPLLDREITDISVVIQQSILKIIKEHINYN
jgi:Fic family protein